MAGNYAGLLGTATYGGAIFNCTVVSNLTPAGAAIAAVYSSGITNSIVFYNAGGNTVNTKDVAYTCTIPLVGSPANFTSAPRFVSETTWDFHLQSNSPCINSGYNAYSMNATDLDGNPRIVGGTVDIGAYEYPTPSSIISYAWLQQYRLPTDGSVDYASLDGTAFDVYQDWVAGLNPTNAASVLQAFLADYSPGIMILWPSVSDRNYFVQRSTNFQSQPFITIQSNIPGHTGTGSYTDTSATNGGPYFYRVGVQ